MIYQKYYSFFIKNIYKLAVYLLRRIAFKLGYSIKKKEFTISEIIINNYFNTNYSKNALISYVITPFVGPISSRHTNQQECYAIAEILKDLLYNVDVIDGNNVSFFPKKKYDIVIDNHNTLERLHSYLNPSCIKILHITHAHLLHQNTAEYNRLLELKFRRGISLKPVRHYIPSNSISYCNFATCLGVQFTADTYSFAEKDIYNIPISTNFTFKANSGKDFDKCRKNFMWFGNTGAVLKGLDLVLEAFAQLPEYKLTVCFPIESEPEFVNAFNHELFGLSNIETLGWVDISSSEFKNLLFNNISVISASASEGGGGSIINCIQGGLIPIVSYQTSINVDGFGIQLVDCSIEEIIQKVKLLSCKGQEELEAMSMQAWKYASQVHTISKFRESFKAVLQSRI